MSFVIFSCNGGHIARPDKVLCDRQDGGHLIVNPPRPVWERSLLKPDELIQWSFLVAATGRAMLDVLPVLQDGCLNYWEAGNWALNVHAEPQGAKNVEEHRRVHLHIFGRSRKALDPDWQWGEAPRFPDFSASAEWSKRFKALDDDECRLIAERTAFLLSSVYAQSGTTESPV